MTYRQKSQDILFMYLFIHLKHFPEPVLNAKEIKHSSHLHITDSPVSKMSCAKTQKQTKTKLFWMKNVEF